MLASAIAEALAEFFVVGLDNIESNLLTDTKIVLKDVRLKPQQSSLPTNTFGNTTLFYVTGFVREVSFTWSWDFLGSDSKSWIKDAVLHINGCRFKVRLVQGDITSDDNENGGDSDDESHVGVATTDAQEQDQESPEQQSKVEEQRTEQTITIGDRINAMLTKQVELLVNSLALTIEDFEVTVEMPSPTILAASTKPPGASVFVDPQEAGNVEIVQLGSFTSPSKPEEKKTPGVSVFEDSEEDGNIEIVKLESMRSETFATGNNNDYTISLKIGCRELNILSYGKYNEETLKEKISVSSIFVNVTETFRQGRRVECKTYPLLESFSYTLGITRTHGDRFSDIGRGLIVKGGLESHFDSDATTSEEDGEQLSLHLSRPQMEAIGQLSGLVLAPEETEISKNDDATTWVGDVSVFDFSFDSVNVDMMDVVLSAMEFQLSCLADGTDLSAKVASLRYLEVPSESKRLATSITFLNVAASLRPSIKVTAGSVSELYVPYVVELRTPIENVQARLAGETWTLDIDSFDGYLPTDEVDHEGHNSPTGHSGNSNKNLIPFPLACKVKRIFLVKEEDEETEVAFADVEILINPKINQSSNELACSVRSMESKLASAKNINTCMIIPADERDANTIRDFALSLDSLSVTAGYTIQDWKRTFRVGGKWKRKTNEIDGTTHFKLPYASVAPLKTKITYSAMRVVSVKETMFLVKAYKGNKGTTLKDLLDFYTSQCLARTPDFLQNAELLGINVKNAGAFSLGANLGSHIAPLGGHIAPFVGVAAVVGVDAVRGSIEAGKRSRRAKEGEAAKIGDFFRGIGYSAVEATRKGKMRRGRGEGRGNVVDWMVGATVNTGDYIGNNKDSLGSAGGAGAGVLVGTILGGPVGAVIGGVVGGMTTGTAIRRIDRRIKNVFEKRESKYEEAKLKPGQLALSP